MSSLRFAGNAVKGTSSKTEAPLPVRKLQYFTCQSVGELHLNKQEDITNNFSNISDI